MMRKLIPGLVIAIFFILPTTLLAQTVEHGRVPAAASVDFSALASYYTLHPDPPVVMDLENEDDDEVPRRTPSTFNIRTRTITATYGPSGPTASLPVSPSPADTFQSTLDPGTAIPPDTHGAVDSNYCMTTINTTVKIQTRAGGAVSSVSLNSFFSAVNPAGGTFDPRVHYDPYAHRWIVVAVSGANNSLDSTSILIAVSKTSNPTGLWWEYRIRAYTPHDYWLDYPDVGFNTKWITVTGNLFQNSPGTGYNGAKVFAFDKNTMYAGGAASFTTFLEASDFTICPALTYDAANPNMFLVETINGFSGQMGLWKLTGAIGSESLNYIATPTSAARWQGSPYIFSGTSPDDFAPQAGTSNKIQNNDDRVTQTTYINGKLWFAHTIFLPYSTSVDATRSAAQWWQIDTLGTPVQIGRVDDATGVNFYAFPTIAVNATDDALMGFSAFSATTFPSAAYALRMHTDPVDSIRPLVIYRHGRASYYKIFSGTRNRWGDYSATCYDPLNTSDFWTLQEASASPSDQWDTWWAHVQVCTPPTATITPGGPTTFCAGGNVVLTGTAGGGFTYQWQSGGSNIVGATNATFTATVTGSYTVIITNSLTCSATSSATAVTVNSNPTATITPGGPTTFCSGGSVVLTATSGAGFTYQWKIGGSNIGGATNVTFTATVTGSYTVLITNSSGCSTTSSATAVTVNTPPGATITPAGPTTFCAGGSVTLNANTGAGFTYQWRVGGSSIGGATNSSFTASASGSYDVIVTSLGCSSTSSATSITANPLPTATITPAGPTTFCSGASVVLNASTGAGYTYQWKLGASNIAGATNSSFTASAGGSYTVFVTALGCSATSAATVITVNPIPTATITPAGPTTFCSGGSVVLNASTGAGYTYQWKLGGSNIGGATNSSFTASASGSYTVFVTAAGCSATSAATVVTVNTPPAATITPGGPTAFCTGGSVVLTANAGAGFTYQWQLGGSNIGGATNISFTASASGNYNVIVTSSGCSTTSSATTVSVNPPPGATITPGGPTAFCTGGNVVLNANTGAGFTYQWQIGGSNIAGATNSSFTASASGNYTVIVTNVGCSSTSAGTTVTVTVGPGATITPAGPTSFCSPGSVVLNANTGAGITYQWHLNGVDISGATTSAITVSSSGDYTVTTSLGGCVVTSAITTVSVTATPVATITPSGPTSFCSPGSVTLNATAGAGFTYQWQLGGSDIPGATDISFVATSAGNYTVRVTNGACSDLSVATTVSISPGPTAAITPAGPTTFCSGSSVVLNASTGAGFTYQWQLTGVDIPGATNSSYTATAGGDYTVVVSLGSCVSTSSAVTITVNPSPGAVITPVGSTTFCAGGSVLLNANTGAGLTYVWKVGVLTIPGATDDNFTATTSGTYTVLVSNGVCTSTSAGLPVVVTATPTAAITPGGPTTFCTGGSVVLNAPTGAGYTYQWMVGGANIPGATASSYTATASGSYTVMVSLGACSSTSSAVTVTSVATTIAAIAGNAPICVGQTLSLTDATPTGTWSSTNPSVATITSTGSVAGLSGGTTTISYTVAGGCGTAAVTTIVTVNALPVVAPITGGATLCAGATLTLADATAGGTWNSGATAVATVNSSGVVTGVAAGTAAITYSVTSAAGCTSRTSTSIAVLPLTAVSVTPAGPTTFCGGGSVLLNATVVAGAAYQWQLGGSNIPGASASSYVATSAGSYTVVLTMVATGCTSVSAPVTVTVPAGSSIVIPRVSINAVPGTVFCGAPTAVTFTAVPTGSSGGSSPSYQWFVNGVPSGTGSTHAYTPAAGDIVKVVMTSTDPCAFPTTGSASDTIVVSPAVTPSVSINANLTDVCHGDTVLYSAIPVNGGTAPVYTWFVNGVLVGSGPSYRYPPANLDVIKVTMVSSFPCVSISTVSATTSAVVHPNIPNAISITASKTMIAPGGVDTFVASAPFGGLSPAYQWRINGAAIAGATNSIFITTALADSDVVSCEVTSSDPCVTPRTEMSSGLRIRVVPVSVKQVAGGHDQFMLMPNPNKGQFTIDGLMKSAGTENVTVVITNLVGQVIYLQDVRVTNGRMHHMVSLGASVPNGNYEVSITSSEDHVVYHVVVDR